MEDISNNIKNFDKLLLTNKVNFREKTKLYSKHDYKKYRKRIYYLIKSIIENKCKDTEITDSFEYFVKDAIEYLKFKDHSNKIQEEYNDISFNEYNDISFNDSFNDSSNNIHCNETKESFLQEVNHLIQNTSIENVNTIDKFITIKKNNYTNNKKIFFPNKKNIF